MKIVQKLLVLLGAIVLSGAVGYFVPTATADMVSTVEVDKEKLIASYKTELQQMLEKQTAQQNEAMKVSTVKAQLQEKDINEGDVFYFDPDTWDILSEDEYEALEAGAAPETETAAAAADSVTGEAGEAATAASDAPAAATGVMPNAEDALTDMSQMIVADDETLDFYEINGTPLGGTDTAASGTEVKDSWVQSQIDANRDQIDDADLAAGADIYNKLDTDYLFDLAEDGLTENERAEAENYLKENLTAEQYETARELYYKYVHLIE